MGAGGARERDGRGDTSRGEPPPATLRPQALWVRVDQNRAKLAVFVALFVAGSAVLLTATLVALPGALFGFPYTWDVLAEADWYWSTYRSVVLVSFGVLLALGSLAAAVQLANAEDWVRSRFIGHSAKVGSMPGFERAVAEMSLAAGLGEPPAIVVLDSEAVNAYALGTTRSSAVIGVSKGLLDSMPVPEQRAVAATLIARIVSGDILFATALAALMGPLRLIRGSAKALASGGAGCAGGGCTDGCAESCCSMPDLSDGCGCLFDGMDDADSATSCLGMIGIGLFVAVIAAITYAAVVTAAWIVTAWGRALHRTTYEKSDAEGMLLLKDPAPMLSALGRAIASDTTIANGDASYDGIFYTQTGGTPAIERIERRRLRRLAEVLGVDGALVMAQHVGGTGT